MKVYSYKTRYNDLNIFIKENHVKIISFGKDNRLKNYQMKETTLHREVYRQLEEYFNGFRYDFDLPLDPEGTSFMKEVWEELVNIEYGETASYKDIARRINKPKAYRAVGMANNKNPLPIIYPCHRVIGSDGSIKGYAYGLDMKKDLLKLEKDSKLGGNNG